jgi:hypothetical protein
MGEFFQILKLKFLVKSFEKILQLATFSRRKDETLEMLYKRLLKLKEDIQSIRDLEATHQYLRLLESTPTLHVQVLQ